MSSSDPTLDRLIAGNDLDELIREVDRRTDARDWEGVLRLRDRCRLALERGFQLWPASSLAEYRLALRAPADWAARVVAEGAGRFTIGPLTEVAASTHTWAELAPFLTDAPLTAVVAHERVVRGEDLRDESIAFADIFDLPLGLEAWEPRWAVPVYRDDRVEEPRPAVPALHPVELPTEVMAVGDDDVEPALLAVVAHWVGQSNGRADLVSVEGNALAAIAALDAANVRIRELEPADALAHVGWAAASGGAHGRRRGAAAGRDLAWEVAAALGGVEHIGDLRWFLWDESGPEIGWHLRLAVEDPSDGAAWALRAVDVADADADTDTDTDTG